MRLNCKQILGSVALSAMALSISATAQVAATAKPAKPPVEAPAQHAPSAEKIDLGQQFDRGNRPTPPPSVEKGIKDQGVKGCGNCGLTGRVAAPPPVDDGAAPAPSVDYEDPKGGQHFDRGNRPTPKPSSKRVKTPKSGKTSSLLPVLGGVTALAALAIAAGGGHGNPASP